MYKICQIYRMLRLEWQQKQWKAVWAALKIIVPVLALSVVGVGTGVRLLLVEYGGYFEFGNDSWSFSFYVGADLLALFGVIMFIVIAVLMCDVVLYVHVDQLDWLGRLALDTPIEANHGDTIEEVIRNLQYEPVEYIAVFDPDGKKVGEVTSLKQSCCSFGDTLWGYMRQHPGCIQIHNHPGRDSTPFSADDFKSAVQSKTGIAIVIAGLMLYTLELPDGLTDDEGDEMHCYHAEHWKKSPLNLEYISKDPKARQDAQAAAMIMLCQDIAAMYELTFKHEPYKTSSYAKPGWSVKHLLQKPSETPACATSQTHKDSLPR